jgi:hypothetical protein
MSNSPPRAVAACLALLFAIATALPASASTPPGDLEDEFYAVTPSLYGDATETPATTKFTAGSGPRIVEVLSEETIARLTPVERHFVHKHRVDDVWESTEIMSVPVVSNDAANDIHNPDICTLVPCPPEPGGESTPIAAIASMDEMLGAADLCKDRWSCLAVEVYQRVAFDNTRYTLGGWSVSGYAEGWGSVRSTSANTRVYLESRAHDLYDNDKPLSYDGAHGCGEFACWAFQRASFNYGVPWFQVGGGGFPPAPSLTSRFSNTFSIAGRAHLSARGFTAPPPCQWLTMSKPSNESNKGKCGQVGALP